MKNIIMDLDGTLTIDEDDKDYANKKPNIAVIEKLKEYKMKGFKITIYTSRNMRTFMGDIEKIKANTLPQIITWLEKHSVPYDDVMIGKPWCGFDGFYVDDKAIRPSEFSTLSYEEIRDLLKKEYSLNVPKELE
ncbi:capsular biosynthesis protein [Helicobacter pullorum]|uniref:HAD-IIIC family phosphatase n=1 Tax=Helicobacter pullorum TaxID=35818 RepID=UPI0008169277|nr:HAD-IIIC family phosphatase [Helicobacter pullorum]OCR12023.1 capsular biosynthesis protein [Helicobacter pullorum]